MDLRKPHHHPFAFDAFLIFLGACGAVIAWLSYTSGEWWLLLSFAAFLGEALLIYGVWIEPRNLTVKRYREALVDAPKVWIRFVFLSDLHAGGFHPAPWYARIAQIAAGLKPDVVVLGGDYVADRYEPINDLQPFASLIAPLGKYFVMGNHDAIDWPQKIRETLTSYGYADLTHRTVTLSRQGRTCELYGIDDTWYGDPQWTVRTSATLPHITISHEPDVLLDLRAGQTDLVLSGHTHGGQVRLPLLGALWPVPTKLGRALDRGRKVVNDIPCIISNGLGETDGRIRLCSPPQIVVIEIGM